MRLDCGCERDWIVNGRSTMRVFDGVSGLNVQCPVHGWTLQTVDRPPVTHVMVRMEIDEARILAPKSPTVRAALAAAGISEVCTGITAAWCPIHGDCKCARDELGNATLDDGACPLHAFDSSHGEGGTE